MADKTLTIGALARLTHTNPAMIRVYEDLGLMPQPHRPDHTNEPDLTHPRVYGEVDVQRVTFLRRCRDLGILNPELHQLTDLIDHPTGTKTQKSEFAERVLANVRDYLHELQGLEKTLAALIDGAGAQALALGDAPEPPPEGFKRMRRLIRKPLSTPSRRGR
ncbi:MAG: MerR family DNA-binding transcriptional regulator [Pseudomonadota bacterium]|nr:MerR family DNA-binding transcriptional regulator [Pseudomonadota bacterium]